MVQLNSDCSVSDQIRIDGIHYEITASHVSEGMCRATWNCSVCNELGAWASLANDPSVAIEMATAGVRVHHQFLHQHDCNCHAFATAFTDGEQAQEAAQRLAG